MRVRHVNLIFYCMLVVIICHYLDNFASLFSPSLYLVKLFKIVLCFTYLLRSTSIGE